MSRERLLIRTLLELADTLVADYDIVDFLYVLCDRALEVVGADASGVMLMNATGALEVAAASSHEMHLLEQFEAELNEGPCVDAHRTGERVDAADVNASTHLWPTIAVKASALGFRSVHARPLRARGQPIGAFNVYRTTPGEMNDDDAAVLAGLAGMASIGILNERAFSGAAEQIGHLKQARDKRAVIEQASAVLADRLGVDQGLTFDWMRRYARNNNQRLRDVAQRFLAGELDAAVLVPPTKGQPRGGSDAGNRSGSV